MPTPAQSRAAAAHKAKRQEAGEKVVSVWLSEVARDRLDALTEKHGTRQKALEALLLGGDPLKLYQEIEWTPPPVKPASAPAIRGEVESYQDDEGNLSFVKLKSQPAFNPRPKPTKGKK